jgi:transposase-like protein
LSAGFDVGMKVRRATGGAGSDLAKYYQELLEEQARSGLSVTEFAEGVGVSAATLYLWRRRLAGSANRAEVGDLLEVQVTDDESGGRGRPMVLAIDGRLRIELEADFDAGALERLLRLLSRC